ncbi:MAG: DivIVA domain-containing protein [Propionibacteriaceae bacterium]|nr:DivIVA domain-containing protein [Propionibacteriaceae bacterium]
MEWFLWMLGVAILGLAAVASSGRLGELPPPVSSTPAPRVPQGDLTGDDLRAARFSVVPRGYSMAQVDDLLDRLAHQLDTAPPTSDRASVGSTRRPSEHVVAQSSKEAEGHAETAPAPQHDQQG